VSTLPHLLYVEDSILSQRLLRKHLQGHADVTCCATSAEADVLLDADSFDLVVADFQLAGEDASALIGRIRARYTHTEMPILAVSSSMDRVLRGTVFRAGATAACTKPLVSAELRTLIDRLLTERKPMWDDYVNEVRTITWNHDGQCFQYAPHLQLLTSGLTAHEAHHAMHEALMAHAAQHELPNMSQFGQAVHQLQPRPQATAPVSGA
jgi:DNA-binding response OmpR family regulator